MPITLGDKAIFGMIPTANDIKYSIGQKKNAEEKSRIKIQLGQGSVTIFDKHKVQKLLIWAA